MLKIAFIGAGSLVFGETLLTDILTFPALRNEIILCLEDIDPKRLDLMYNYMQKYREDNLQDLEGVTVEKTTDQKKAVIVTGSNVVYPYGFKNDLDQCTRLFRRSNFGMEPYRVSFERPFLLLDASILYTKKPNNRFKRPRPVSKGWASTK